MRPSAKSPSADRLLANISTSMLDQAPVNVLFADRELIIRYANQTSLTQLRRIERLLPCPVDAVIGQSIDIFHKNPAHQRALLANDGRNLPHRATIALGDERLDLFATAVRDGKGAFIGVMVTWEIITDKLKLIHEQERLSSIVENAPVNILMCNKEFTIVYCNPSSLKTLRTIEKLLPCRADDIIGRSIDIFHKNPAHQRNLLSDQKNLPHRATIRLGPETLDLLATATIDKEGRLLGTMVTWSVITDRVAKFDERVRALKNAATTLAAASVQLSSSSQQMAASVEQTTRQSEAVAATTEQADRNAQVVASSATEMSSAVAEIARNMQNTNQMTGEATRSAETANQTITKLGDSSQKIGTVVKLITSIAQQTNLLALNATIEAARAGEAGKGFAVVANEVKELAKQTAKATEEISAQIQTIQGDAGESVKAIASITKIIQQISSVSSTVASATEQQSSTTEEISRNIHQLATSTKDISKNILGVSEASKSTAQVASSLRESSDGLARLATELQTLVDRFEM